MIELGETFQKITLEVKSSLLTPLSYANRLRESVSKLDEMTLAALCVFPVTSGVITGSFFNDVRLGIIVGSVVLGWEVHQLLKNPHQPDPNGGSKEPLPLDNLTYIKDYRRKKELDLAS